MANFIEINKDEEGAWLLNLDAVKFIIPTDDGNACLVYFTGDPWVDDEGNPTDESTPNRVNISYPEMKKLLKLK